MRAGEVLAAIHAHHAGKAAIVHELTLTDDVAVGPESDAWAAAGYPPGGAPTTYRRIDALMVQARRFTAIEVKVSRADFRRDTEAKRRAWQAVTHRFVYAVPERLVAPDEVPDGCGLWYVTPSSLVVARRARVNRDPDPLPVGVVQVLMYRAMRQASTEAT